MTKSNAKSPAEAPIAEAPVVELPDAPEVETAAEIAPVPKGEVKLGSGIVRKNN